MWTSSLGYSWITLCLSLGYCFYSHFILITFACAPSHSWQIKELNILKTCLLCAVMMDSKQVFGGGRIRKAPQSSELDPEVGEGCGWQVQKGCAAQLCHFYQGSSKRPLICCHVLHSHCVPGTVRERGMLEAGRKQPSSCCSGQGSFIRTWAKGLHWRSSG